MKIFRLYIYLLILLIPVVIFNSCEKDPPDKDDNNGEYTYDPTPYNLERPQSFPPLEIPSDNPLTEEGIKLGRMLFYDPILSVDSTIACASCHKQENAFTDPRRFSQGVHGTEGVRNSMPLFNLVWHSSFFWDGRAGTIEEQIFHPVVDPDEMGAKWTSAVQRLKNHKDYPRLLYNAFGTLDIDSTHVSKSIAQFLRIILSYNSRHDKFQRGELFGTVDEFTDSESNGLDLILDDQREKADCFHCHGNILFNDVSPNDQFRNNGLVDASGSGDFKQDFKENNNLADPGRGGVKGSGNDIDLGKFKAPSLRNIELTAPYMHDGRFQTLEEVIDFYNEGVHTDAYNVDDQMNKANRADGSLGLTEQEKTDIINYLKTLTDEELINNPEYSNPFK
ncbi:MAG: cytochrome c peroxidase [Chitinophagales bacterium]